MKRLGIWLLILGLVMMMFTAVAEEKVVTNSNTDDVTMQITLNGFEMVSADGYVVRPGDEIVVKATTHNGSHIAMIGYYYYDEGYDTVFDTYETDTITIIVPAQASGTERVLCIEAVTDANCGKEDPTNRTGWQFFFLTWDTTSIIKSSDLV